MDTIIRYNYITNYSFQVHTFIPQRYAYGFDISDTEIEHSIKDVCVSETFFQHI